MFTQKNSTGIPTEFIAKLSISHLNFRIWKEIHESLPQKSAHKKEKIASSDSKLFFEVHVKHDFFLSDGNVKKTVYKLKIRAVI